MPPLLRYVSPAGAPISVADVARWLPAAATGDGRAGLVRALESRFGDRHYVLASTGRAAMTLLFRAMRRMVPATRDEIVLPAYTCYSVAASAAKAGLKVRLADVDPATLDYDLAALEALDFRRVIALVATNLYGLPNNLPALARLASDRGILLIDDAAQAMGASIDGRPSGTWGDAGLFSFDKGKNICAIDGGVLTTDSEAMAAALAGESAALTGPGAAASAVHVAKALAYAVLLRPSLYGLVTRIPQLELGTTVFTTAFPLHGPDPVLAALASTMLPKLDAYTAARRENAATLLRGLADLTGIRTVRPVTGAAPVYLRLPVLCTDETARNEAIAALNAAGIGASGSYPGSLADVPEVQRLMAPGDCRADGGREIARSILTLPTHPFVEAADITRTLEVLAGLSASRRQRPMPPAASIDRRTAPATASAQRLRENH